MEYIDVDMNEEELKDLDRYHIFLSTQGTQVECVEANQNQAQPHTEGAGGQWETEPSASEACQSGPLEKCQGENDGVHRFDAANLVVLINNKAPSVLAEYEKSGTLSLASRKLLVRTGVSDLVERRGFYPSNADKLMLAKSITTIFPSLKIKIQEANEGFEHFYDPVSHCGFIELKLRNLRRNLHEDQRRYRKRGKSSEASGVAITLQAISEGEEESAKDWITATKRIRPSPENLTSIKMGMQKTFNNRRFWISSQSPTVEEILQEYPRFVDMPYLIDAEFARMFPGKEDLFLRKWEGHIVPKLLKVATLENENDPSEPSVGEEIDESRCFRALKLLTRYLPPTASGRSKGWTKCSVKSALSYILEVKPTGTSIPSLLQGSLEAAAGAAGVHQPKLVCIGHPSTTAQYIIVARNDKVAIPLQDEGLTCALDKLFKMLWVCNVAYPVQLESVYSFFEHVYDMPISGAKRSKVLELIAKLQALV
ncbi:uncharacterized protein LOC114439177 isoform X2 [Parambassis ranga]|nr:uncharacterized protein LOC114438918 isoform X2 [Parambassis ranga]XP_028266367.1 uncharacterized protein LOC114438918 isoform X2 [Parambassis ranga]XP_028266794.1 uncharacterized protein LOC114439177 isoform X2 [Parambassis ranga]XP_028266802.1 uncharacterized protein LOC114439177 isoform X2 [Parambassis ranga]